MEIGLAAASAVSAVVWRLTRPAQIEGSDGAPPPPTVDAASLPGWWPLGAEGAVLIDANNVRGALAFEVDAVDLAAALCRAARSSGASHRIALCVDHGPATSAIECGGIVVSFAGPKDGKYETADDMIVADVLRAAKIGSGPLVVVTSDRLLTRRCQRACFRWPECQLRVVPSLQLADWLHTSGALRDELATRSNDHHLEAPEVRWHAFGTQLAPIASHRRVSKKNKSRPGRAALVKNGGESTACRIAQADGLHARLATWEARGGAAEADGPSGSNTPNWLQNYLVRHPWRS